MVLSVLSLSSFFIPKGILVLCIFSIAVSALSQQLDVDFVHALKFTVMRKYCFVFFFFFFLFPGCVTLSAEIRCIVNNEYCYYRNNDGDELPH